MFYTYVIQRKKDNKWYTGFTPDLRKRFRDHNSNKVFSTKEKGPFKLIYYESCLNEKDAKARERYLKSGMGKRYLKNRLKRFLSLTGFTLIELIAVITILSLVMVLVLPQLDSFTPKTRLKAAARRISHTISWIQNEAITTGEDYQICYDLNNQQYWVVLPSTDPETEKNDTLIVRDLPAGVKFKNIVISTGQEITAEQVLVRLTAKGTVDSHQITLINKKQAQLTLAVNPLTGLVEVTEGIQE